MTENQTIKGSHFSASRINELLAAGGKSAANYILDMALQECGFKQSFHTKEMTHGVTNQMSGFEQIIKPVYKDALWYDEFIEINPHCGASPDVMIDSITPADIKCPYYIDTYLQQIQSLPKKYFLQVQMQLLATGGDVGLLVYFLTRPETWGDETWAEYQWPLSKRHKVFEIIKSDEVHYEILQAVEKAVPKKIELMEKVKEAIDVELNDFFEMQLKDYKFRKIKDASNIFGVDQFYRVGNEFYYKVSGKEKE